MARGAGYGATKQGASDSGGGCRGVLLPCSTVRACSQVQKGGVPTCLDLVAVTISADTRTWGQQNFFLSTRYKTAIRHSAQCAAENSHTHGKG